MNNLLDQFWVRKMIVHPIVTTIIKIKIRAKYTRHFRLVKKTIKTVEKMLHDEIIIWSEDDDFLKLSICMLARTIGKLQTMQLLCKKGLARDAAILLRVVYEDLLTFVYINENLSELNDFIDYDNFLRLKLGQHVPQGTIQNQEIFDKRTAELQHAWNAVKHRFLVKDKKGKMRVRKTWNNKSVEQMSRELGLLSVYNGLYRYLSLDVHFNTISGGYNIEGLSKNGKTVVVSTGMKDDMIDEVLPTAACLVVDMLGGVVNKKYGLKMDKALDMLIVEVKKLNPKASA